MSATTFCALGQNLISIELNFIGRESNIANYVLNEQLILSGNQFRRNWFSWFCQKENSFQ